jgi:hypothetical protein
MCTNIIHMNITQNSCDFYINLWKSHFTQNLYKPMKLDKFVMEGPYPPQTKTNQKHVHIKCVPKQLTQVTSNIIKT